MEIIINILFIICVIWTIISIAALAFLTRPSAREYIKDFIANLISDNISDFVYGEHRSNRKNTNHIYR